MYVCRCANHNIIFFIPVRFLEKTQDLDWLVTLTDNIWKQKANLKNAFFMLKYIIDFVSEDVDLWRFPDDKLWIVRKETVLKACDPFHLLSHKKVFFSPLL